MHLLPLASQVQIWFSLNLFNTMIYFLTTLSKHSRISKFMHPHVQDFHLLLLPILTHCFNPYLTGSAQSEQDIWLACLLHPLLCYCADHSQIVYSPVSLNEVDFFSCSIIPVNKYGFVLLCCNNTHSNSFVLNWLPSNFWWQQPATSLHWMRMSCHHLKHFML